MVCMLGVGAGGSAQCPTKELEKDSLQDREYVPK